VEPVPRIDQDFRGLPNLSLPLSEAADKEGGGNGIVPVIRYSPDRKEGNAAGSKYPNPKIRFHVDGDHPGTVKRSLFLRPKNPVHGDQGTPGSNPERFHSILEKPG
jgi:hypothetical protein